MKEKFQQVTIIGGGPAGLSAAINMASEGLSVGLVDCSYALGGQAKYSTRIENYLGFSGGITGQALMHRAKNQAHKFGTQFYLGSKAVNLTREGKYRCVQLENGIALVSRAVILAGGLQWRSLNLPEIRSYQGKSLFYGASLNDGPAYADKTVAIIGGANSAGQAAMHFSEFCKLVLILVRGDSLEKGMSQYLIDRISETSNIKVLTNTELNSLNGQPLETLTLTCKGTSDVLPCDGIFVFIGAEPKTSWLTDSCEMDERGFIVTTPNKHTNCTGVFAIGDVRKDSIKRIAAGVGEGSGVAPQIYKYVNL